MNIDLFDWTKEIATAVFMVWDVLRGFQNTIARFVIALYVSIFVTVFSKRKLVVFFYVKTIEMVFKYSLLTHFKFPKCGTPNTVPIFRFLQMLSP